MHYVIIALIVALGLLGFDNYHVRNDNKELHVSVGRKDAQIKELGGALETKDHDIKLANDNLDTLKKDAEEREAKAAAATAKANVLARKNQILSDQLLAKEMKPGEDPCKAANDLIDQYLDERRKENEIENSNNK